MLQKPNFGIMEHFLPMELLRLVMRLVQWIKEELI